MKIDERQLRTTNNNGLIGYRAKFHGENVIAIMKGKECWECLGYISTNKLIEMVNTGPYIDLDKLILAELNGKVSMSDVQGCLISYFMKRWEQIEK